MSEVDYEEMTNEMLRAENKALRSRLQERESDILKIRKSIYDTFKNAGIDFEKIKDQNDLKRQVIRKIIPALSSSMMPGRKSPFDGLGDLIPIVMKYARGEEFIGDLGGGNNHAGQNRE